MKAEIKEDQVTLENRERINYRYLGQGQPLLLIHGNMSSSVFWDHTLEAMADSYTVIAPDLRGFGQSSYQKKIESIEDFAEDMILFIEKLSLKNIHLAGWSLGGAVALTLVLKRPDLFKSLGLFACAGLGREKKGTFWQLPAIRDVMGTDWPRLPEETSPLLGYGVEMLWETTMYNIQRPNPEDYEKYLAGSLAQRNRKEVILALRDFSVKEEDWEKITLPVLRIQGREDRVLGLPRHIHRTAHCRLYIFEDCGHFIMNDQFDQFIQTYKEFLRKGIKDDQNFNHQGN